jgi:NADPH-ferrihemoprotein reductase
VNCRKRDEDYIYRDELAAWQADGTLSELHTAFSREVDGKKDYVQVEFTLGRERRLV